MLFFIEKWSWKRFLRSYYDQILRSRKTKIVRRSEFWSSIFGNDRIFLVTVVHFAEWSYIFDCDRAFKIRIVYSDHYLKNIFLTIFALFWQWSYDLNNDRTFGIVIVRSRSCVLDRELGIFFSTSHQNFFESKAKVWCIVLYLTTHLWD